MARTRALPGLAAKSIQARNVTPDDQRVDVMGSFVGGDALKIHDVPNHGMFTSFGVGQRCFVAINGCSGHSPRDAYRVYDRHNNGARRPDGRSDSAHPNFTLA